MKIISTFIKKKLIQNVLSANKTLKMESFGQNVIIALVLYINTAMKNIVNMVLIFTLKQKIITL